MTGAGLHGRFLSFEGGEGAGKSTQVRLLQDNLAHAGIAAICTREPGGSSKAEAIRRLLLSGAVKPYGHVAEAMMFSAARIDHLDATIRPALAAGTWVICDRFADSTRAYQGALGQMDVRVIEALEQVAPRFPLDFCLVVTQRRHLADTRLSVVGLAAAEWMAIAQAFAGGPGAGRQPGQFAITDR